MTNKRSDIKKKLKDERLFRQNLEIHQDTRHKLKTFTLVRLYYKIISLLKLRIARLSQQN